MVSELHFPPNTYYSCTECGKCCSAPWRIQVDPPKAAQIRETEAYQSLTRKGYQPLAVLDEQFELARREDGSCFFLRDDNLCQIHAEKGLEAKPAVCQLYPFLLVATPEGYYVSLQFTCPAVLSGDGGPITNHGESLAATVRAAPHFFPPDLVPGNKVTLTAKASTDFYSYLAFEERLLQTLDLHEDIVGILLEGAASVIDGSWSSEPDPATWQLWEALYQVFHLFFANSVASMERKAEPDERAEYAQCLLHGGQVRSELLKADAPPYRPGAGVCQLTRNVIKRYVQNKIWGKNLLTGPSLAVRLLLLALSLEVLTYYYLARKEQLGVRHFDLEILEWSFDLVETDFLLHDDLVMPLVEEWARMGMEISEGQNNPN